VSRGGTPDGCVLPRTWQIQSSDLACIELFNLLINPTNHEFALRWHRDDVRETADEEEEIESLALWHNGVRPSSSPFLRAETVLGSMEYVSASVITVLPAFDVYDAVLSMRMHVCTSCLDHTSILVRQNSGGIRPRKMPRRILWTCRALSRSFLSVRPRLQSMPASAHRALSWRNDLLQLEHPPLRHVQPARPQSDPSRLHGGYSRRVLARPKHPPA
jgi:hypothetical protein